MLHANETGISSGSLGLWLMCAFTFLPVQTKRDVQTASTQRAPDRLHLSWDTQCRQFEFDCMTGYTVEEGDLGVFVTITQRSWD